MATALITIEGVLAASRDGSEKIVNSAPIPVGLVLYHTLSEAYRIVLITAEEDPEPVEHFLAGEGLAKHALLSVQRPRSTPTSLDEATSTHLAEQRSTGHVALLVTPSPVAAAETMRAGVPTLLFLPPNYARPEFRPDFHKAPRPWDAIEAEVTAQRRLRAADDRLVP